MFVNIGAIGIVLLLTLGISVNYLQTNRLISFYSYFQNLVKKTSRKSHNHREGLPKTPKKDQTSHKLFLNKVITMTAKTDQKTTIRYQYRTKHKQSPAANNLNAIQRMSNTRTTDLERLLVILYRLSLQSSTSYAQCPKVS